MHGGPQSILYIKYPNQIFNRQFHKGVDQKRSKATSFSISGLQNLIDCSFILQSFKEADSCPLLISCRIVEFRNFWTRKFTRRFFYFVEFQYGRFIPPAHFLQNCRIQKFLRFFPKNLKRVFFLAQNCRIQKFLDSKIYQTFFLFCRVSRRQIHTPCAFLVELQNSEISEIFPKKFKACFFLAQNCRIQKFLDSKINQTAFQAACLPPYMALWLTRALRCYIEPSGKFDRNDRKKEFWFK